MYMGVKKSREQNNETSRETEKEATTEITPTLKDEDQKLSEKTTKEDMDSNDVKGFLTTQTQKLTINCKFRSENRRF